MKERHLIIDMNRHQLVARLGYLLTDRQVARILRGAQ